MSRTYIVTFVVKAPEEWDREFNPYAFDEPFNNQGAEIEDVGVDVVNEETE